MNAMDEDERVEFLAKEAAAAKHEKQKSKMLSKQMKGYGGKKIRVKKKKKKRKVVTGVPATYVTGNEP